MLSAFQHGDGHRGVEVIGKSNDYRVDVGVLGHLVEVGVGFGNVVSFGHRLEGIGTHVAGGNYLDTGIVLEREYMIIANDDTCAEDSDSYLVHVLSPQSIPSGI